MPVVQGGPACCRKTRSWTVGQVYLALYTNVIAENEHFQHIDNQPHRECFRHRGLQPRCGAHPGISAGGLRRPAPGHGLDHRGLDGLETKGPSKAISSPPWHTNYAASPPGVGVANDDVQAGHQLARRARMNLGPGQHVGRAWWQAVEMPALCALEAPSNCNDSRVTRDFSDMSTGLLSSESEHNARSTFKSNGVLCVQRRCIGSSNSDLMSVTEICPLSL